MRLKENPKEEASTFTHAQRRLSLLTLSINHSSSPLLLLLLLSFLPIFFIPPQATVCDPDSFLVFPSPCHNFKRRRHPGHPDVPGASVPVPSQVYVSQRVLDDTLFLSLSFSPVSLLLISEQRRQQGLQLSIHRCNSSMFFTSAAEKNTQTLNQSEIRMCFLSCSKQGGPRCLSLNPLLRRGVSGGV